MNREGVEGRRSARGTDGAVRCLQPRACDVGGAGMAEESQVRVQLGQPLSLLASFLVRMLAGEG